MRVGRADDKPFPRQFHLSAQPPRHFLNYLRAYRAIVDCHQHSRPTVRLAVGSNCQSPHLEPAGNTLRLGLTRLVTDHPNRIIRRDVDDGSATGTCSAANADGRPINAAAITQNKLMRRISRSP